MDRILRPIAILVLVALVGPSPAPAQVDKYVEIASSRRQSPIYYEAFADPGQGEKPVVVVSYKIPHDRLVFMRHHEGGAERAFRAGLDVTVEIFQNGERIDSQVLKQEVFAAEYETTIDPLKGMVGAVTFQLDPGSYGFRLQVTDQSTQRSAASLLRPVAVPDFPAGAFGKAIIAANIEESDLFREVDLSNLGGDAHFGEGAYAIIPFTLGDDADPPHLEWTLRKLDPKLVEEERRKRTEQIRRRAREAEGEVGIAVEADDLRSSEGGIAVLSGEVPLEDLVALKSSAPVDVLPDKVRLTEADAEPDYYVAIVNLGGEKLDNGAYALDVNLKGSSEAPQTSRFDTHWPDMPFSLFDVDVAIKNMEFILSRDEIKLMRSGGREEKIANFESFWKERDPTPETAYNELMTEYFKRVDFAALEYRTGAGYIPNGLKTDRAKVYIVHGPPDDVSRAFPDGGGVLETWTYRGGRSFTFEAPSSLDPFHMVDGS